MKYDVVIIGAGTMGMAAGYYLAKENKNVALIDAYNPPHSEGAHHGETRIIRHAYGEGEVYVPFVLRAQELWNELGKKSGRNVFLKTGVLNIGTSDSAFLQNVISSAEQYNLNTTVMSAEEVNRKWKGFNLPDHLSACYEIDSGVLMSEECIRAYRELAEKEGAAFYFNTNVLHIELTKDNVTIQLQNEMIQAEKLVITAGKGTNDILKLIDNQLPLQPVRKTFSWFEADEKKYDTTSFPAWTYDVGDCTYYGFPSIDGAGLKTGRHDGGHPVDAKIELAPFGSYPEDQADVESIMKLLLADDHPHKDGKVCTYTNSPDGDFIIDTLPDHHNVTIACGFSGHGFKFGSVVGEMLSQLVIDGETKMDISSFSMSRFK